MFLGEATHSLDAKGRLTLPAKYRDHFKAGLYVVRGEEHCLQVYPPQAWANKEAEVLAVGTATQAARQYRRFVFSGTEEADLDAAGRVLIKEEHRTWAGLDKDVLVIGVGEFLELWDKDRWEADRPEREEMFGTVPGSIRTDVDNSAG